MPFYYFQKNIWAISRYVAALLFLIPVLAPLTTLSAGSLFSIKDTLSSSRPSQASTVISDITAGDFTINISSTLEFVPGDAILLCTTGCAISETVIIDSITNFTQLRLVAGTSNSYLTGSHVYLRSTSVHTVHFTTSHAVTGGKFIITVPGANTPNGRVPDTGGFAFNGLAISDINLIGGSAGIISTSTSGSNLQFTVPFSGSVASSTSITITLGGTTQMLNPVKVGTQGTADTFVIQVDEQDSGGNVIDINSAKVGTIESILVSASVIATTFNFVIYPVPAGTTVAGVTMDADTTASSAPFGLLAANTNRTVAQYIHIDTNSTSGYNITAHQDGSLRKVNGSVIPDYNTTAADNNANNGFGYSLQNKNNNHAVFQYNDSGTFYSKGFSSTTAVTIMTNNAPGNSDEVYVIYRARVSSSQPQGLYQNLVTYIATPIY